MTEPAPFPVDGRLTQTAHSLFQPSDWLAPGITFQHLSILPSISRRPRRISAELDSTGTPSSSNAWLLMRARFIVQLPQRLWLGLHRILLAAASASTVCARF